jgi:hypothetical protein
VNRLEEPALFAAWRVWRWDVLMSLMVIVHKLPIRAENATQRAENFNSARRGRGGSSGRESRRLAFCPDAGWR